MVPFSSLPASSRVWVFAADTPLTGNAARELLVQTDEFLERWAAHGQPLRCSRDWVEDRFLVIGVDPTAEQASGCSIDGLFRALQRLETEIGTKLIGGGRVFYRDAAGRTVVASREEFVARLRARELADDTQVFDTSLTQLDTWRRDFVRPLAESWASRLAPAAS